MEGISALGVANLAGGGMGAFIKIAAGLFMLWLKNKREARAERAVLSGKNQDFIKAIRPDPGSEFVSYTRRVLAWSVCWTFCAICLLWAVFPGYPVHAIGGEQSTAVNLLLWSNKVTRDLGNWWTTGAIVWQLTPFVSMVLMTYFTPNVSKI